MSTYCKQRGVSMVELLIAMPMFVLFIFIIAELGMMYQAKSVVDMATLAAARAGAIKGGDPSAMKNAAALALAPLYVNDTGTVALTAGWLKAKADTSLPHMVGTTDVTNLPRGPVFNGIGGGLQSGLQVVILSPTKQMMNDFGVKRVDGAGNQSSSKVIPSDNLTYRDTKLLNEVNVQDANLLKIKVTYLYEMKMPITRYFFTPLMNANLTRVLFGAERIGNTADLGWRVPLVGYATVRMQSDFKEASLSGAGTDEGGGWSGSDDPGGSTTPPTGDSGPGNSGNSDGSGESGDSGGTGETPSPANPPGSDSSCGG